MSIEHLSWLPNFILTGVNPEDSCMTYQLTIRNIEINSFSKVLLFLSTMPWYWWTSCFLMPTFYIQVCETFWASWLGTAITSSYLLHKSIISCRSRCSDQLLGESLATLIVVLSIGTSTLYCCILPWSLALVSLLTKSLITAEIPIFYINFSVQ